MPSGIAVISTATIYGGGEAMLGHALRHLEDSAPGSVLLCTPPNPRLEEEASAASVHVIKWPFSLSFGSSSGLLQYLKAVFISNLWCLRMVRSHQIRTLVLNGPGGLPSTALARLLTRVKIVTWVHTVIKQPFYRLVLGCLYWGHQVICVSEAAAAPLRTPKNSEILKVIYNGVRIPRSKSLRPFGQPVRVLSAGRITEGKGIHLLLEALGKLSPEDRSRLKVDIAGKAWTQEDEAYLRGLQTQVQNLGLEEKVSFLGFLDLSQSIGQYDVLVFTSLLTEACPMIVLEAMANGLLVLASRTGGVTEMIQDGTHGFLHEPSDTATLASQLSCILSADFHQMRLESIERCAQSFELSKQLTKMGRQIDNSVT